MWTGPQIEAESPCKQPGTLSRARSVRRGKGKTGVGDMVKGKGVSQEKGRGDECHPDVTIKSLYLLLGLSNQGHYNDVGMYL
jgi:hypothetical protein